MADSKATRRYQTGVERALGLFDASNEWADYIAFLSRLLKALQACPPGADLPSKSTLAKRLSQCLRPSLPGGVHQKALEVYGLVFNLLGEEGLARDLQLYLPGISHTLSFAALATRPWLLSLYNDHILKLSATVLRPAVKSIILSLLPGIEEENSEDFDINLTTFNRLRGVFKSDGVEQIFWQNLFLASITSANRRGGVLIYLSRYLPRLGLCEEHDAAQPVKVVTTPEPGLLFRCFATGLTDEQPLIQRGFLDLLVTHLPLDAETLQRQQSLKDLDVLMGAALSIVLRRDVSLNRRLWTWLSVSDEKHEPETPQASSVAFVTEPHQDYFSKFGLASVLRTLDDMIRKQPTSPLQRARPFRLLISLMDRTSVGQPVVKSAFDVFLADLRKYQTTAPTQDAFDEVFKSANAFFESVEPQIVMKFLLKLFRQKNLDLLDFAVSNFELGEDESLSRHIPVVVYVLSLSLGDSSKGERSWNSQQRAQIIGIIDLLLISITTSPIPLSADTYDSSEEDLKEYVHKFDNEDSDLALTPEVVTAAISMSLDSIALATIEYLNSTGYSTSLQPLGSSFVKLLTLAPARKDLVNNHFKSELLKWTSETPDDHGNFAKCKVITNIVIVLMSLDMALPTETDMVVYEIAAGLIEKLWMLLSPETPQYHVEIVEMIWTLRTTAPDVLLVDSVLMSELTSLVGSDAFENHPSQKFSILWAHSKVADPQTPGGSVLAVPLERQPSFFLKRFILYIVDAAENAALDDPWALWLGSLPSMETILETILDRLKVSSQDEQEFSAGLNRLRTIVSVLARSPTLAKTTFTIGPLYPNLVGFLLTLLNNPGATTQEPQRLIALDLICRIHEDSQIAPQEGIMEALVKSLANTEPSSPTEGRLLETFGILLATRSAANAPPELLPLMISGISGSPSKNMEKWISLFCKSVALYPDAIFFANLLKITASFCKRSQSYFHALQSQFSSTKPIMISPMLSNAEASLTNLLAGLEYVLAQAHGKTTNTSRPTTNGTESQHVEIVQSRAAANSRLTVILCMQDAIKLCGEIWSWRGPSDGSNPIYDLKSFNYIASKFRSRSRKLLEHLIDAEPQECLETVMGIWVERVRNAAQPHLIMNLLQTLDGARPRFMLPAIFNAIYSRNNPGDLDQSQRSTLSVDVSATGLVAFLIEYVSKLEDDLLEEIWGDCTSFVRDVLANPMPQRQILMRLLEFLSSLCSKMENTTFGEQPRMRREFSDLCSRVFTAVFTIKPVGFDQSSDSSSTSDKPPYRLNPGGGIDIFLDVLPVINPVLTETDRIATVFAGISNNIIAPQLKSKKFPQNVTQGLLELLKAMSRAQNAAKLWRKDCLDAFNENKLFQSPYELGETGWMPLFRQLAIAEKSLLPDILTRLAPPSTAGLVFGVGASAARTEADKQTKANLRRIGLLLLVREQDAYLSGLPQTINKLEELLTATTSTSPSSGTFGEVFLLLRIICLSVTPGSLVQLWPIIDSALQYLLDDLMKGEEATMSVDSHLQGAKLLDVLLLMKPEEFQLHEWLYVTDTIDAIYPVVNQRSIAAADLLTVNRSGSVDLPPLSTQHGKKPWLSTDPSRYQATDAHDLLSSFFSQLSIRAFEDTYRLESLDLGACRSDALRDLFTVAD